MADFKIRGTVFTIDESEIKDFMKTEDMDRNTAVRCYFEDAGIIETSKKTTITEIEQTAQKRHYVK